jgi:hypothetical protein
VKLNTDAQQMQRINVLVIDFHLEGEGTVFPDLGKIKLDQNSQL